MGLRAASPAAPATPPAVLPPSPDPDSATNEPPPVLFLEVAGRTFPVGIDQALPAEALQAAQGGAAPVLRMAPYREFHVLGLSFRFPREFVFDTEPGEDGVRSWTFSGRDATLIVDWFPSETDHRSLRRDLVKDFQDSLKEEDPEVRPKRSSANLTHPHGRLDGERVSYRSQDIDAEQSMFSFRGGEGSFVLRIQDSAEGTPLPSAEKRAVEQWLRDSLTLPPVTDPPKKPRNRPEGDGEIRVQAGRRAEPSRPRG